MNLFLKNKILFLSWFIFFLTNGFLSAEEKPFSIDRKPFNYKAFEARKKGQPIVIYRIPQELVPNEYLKISPSWPGHLRFPNPGNTGILYAQIGGNWANWAYNSDRNLADPSQLLFGMQDPTLSDLSLIARLHGRSLKDMPNPLLKNGTDNDITTDQWIVRTTESASSADPEVVELGTLPVDRTQGDALSDKFRANKRYLAFLADKFFDFKSKMREPFMNFSYQASMFNGKVSVGIELPIIYRSQELDMVKELAIEDNQILSRDARFTKVNDKLQDYFFAKYPGGYKDFWKDMLKQKDFTTDPKSTRFGIGDITFFITRKFEGNDWSLGLVGLGLTVPSASTASKKFVWPVELGNGGFWEVRPYLAMHWQQSQLVNPHVYSEIRFCFSNQVDRRVSSLITFDAASKSANIAAKNLPLGSTLAFANHDFKNEPESNIPALAAGPLQTIELVRGTSAIFRVGNLFDQIIFERGYFDFYYQFTYKFPERLATRVNENLYDMKALIRETESWQQQVAATFVYRWNETMSFEVQGNYIFSGKNCLRTCGINIATQIRI